jgi:hypothetical protein
MKDPSRQREINLVAHLSASGSHAGSQADPRIHSSRPMAQKRERLLDMLQPLSELKYSTGVLIAALESCDADKAHEAVSVMLMQFMHKLADNDVAAAQFFPVLDRLEQLIAQSQLTAALRQAATFDRQLGEIIAMISP